MGLVWHDNGRASSPRSWNKEADHNLSYRSREADEILEFDGSVILNRTATAAEGASTAG